jgi:integrase
MPTIRFNAKNLDGLSPIGAQVQTDYFDAAANVPGFGLRVTRAGSATWFLMYRVAGKQKRLKVGTYPPMLLADARQQARTELLRVQVDEADPSAARKARRTAQTFGELAERFVEDYAKQQKRSWREDARQLRSMVLTKWKNTAAEDIARADVRALLGAVARDRGGVVANRLRALLSKLFRWAVAQDYLPANPASELPKLTRETSRARVLSDDEIRALWARLEAAEQDGSLAPTVALWLRLRLLTAQRGGTVSKMQWAHADLERAVWEIPAADMKAANEHVVPLSPSVVKLLKAQRTLNPDATYVLQGGRSRRIRLGVTEAIGIDDFKPHDLRRTAATNMARAGVQRFVIARVLGHVDRAVTGVYDRYEYLNEKRTALEAWDRQLTAILKSKPAARNVVTFARS